MCYRRGEFDMPHPLTAHLRMCDFHAALVADDAFVADLLVLAAIALIILCRPEDAFAEKSVSFRLERPVVNRLGGFVTSP